MKDLKDNIRELTAEEKKKIVEEANATPDTPEGNTTVTQIADDEKLMQQIESMTPKELFESNIAASFRSIHALDKMLPQLSKKNLVKLLLATLKLPEDDLYVNFGGQKKDKELALECFMKCQIARNAYAYVVSIRAAAQARLAKRAEEENKQTEGCAGDCGCDGNCGEACQCETDEK